MSHQIHEQRSSSRLGRGAHREPPAGSPPLPAVTPSSPLLRLMGPENESVFVTPSARSHRLLVALRDEAERRDLAGFLARHGFPVVVTGNGREALEAVTEHDIFLALADTVLDDCSGIEILEAVRANQWPTRVVLTSRDDDIESAVATLRTGAFDFLRKPLSGRDILDLVERASERSLITEREQQIVRLRERDKLNTRHQTEFMLALVRIIDAKSRYTRQHSERVGRISRCIAMELGLSARSLDRVELGGRLHDIGKIGTPESILNKRGPLTDHEFAIIKEHPVQGAELVRPIGILQPLIPMILHHHENLDGSGYPDGLRGDQISLEAQIVKLADAYDAMTSARPYRTTPLDAAGALEVLEDCRDETIRGDLIDALRHYRERRRRQVRPGRPLAVA